MGLDFLFGGKGQAGEAGLLSERLAGYGDEEALRMKVNDYWSSIMQGDQPDWMKRYLPQIQQESDQAINREYLGEGNRRSNSAMGLAGQIGAQTGVGPKATIAQQGKVNYELQAKKAAAKAAMDKYRMNFMGQNAMTAPQGMALLPQGQRTFSSAYNVAPTQGSQGFLKEAFGQVMNAGLSAATGGLTSMLGKIGQPKSTQTQAFEGPATASGEYPSSY